MKRKILYLVAAVCFYIAGFIYFFFVEDNSVTFGAMFVSLGTAFVGLYFLYKKKDADKETKA